VVSVYSGVKILGTFGQKALIELPSVKELFEIGTDYINRYLNP